MEDSSVGKNIAKYRKKAKLTQEQLADAIGVDRKRVSNWERGKSDPYAYLIPKITKALNVTPNELFGYKEKVIPTKEEVLANKMGDVTDFSKEIIGNIIKTDLEWNGLNKFVPKENKFLIAAHTDNENMSDEERENLEQDIIDTTHNN